MEPEFCVPASKSRFQIFTFKPHSVEDARIVEFTEIGKHVHFQILYFQDNFHLLQKSGMINISFDRESNSLQTSHTTIFRKSVELPQFLFQLTFDI